MKAILVVLAPILTSFVCSAFAVTSESGLYAKCSITITKIGSPDKEVCRSTSLPTKCIPNSPGEPELCSPTGKLSLQNEGVAISAEFINFSLSAWVNSGDKKWMVTKVNTAAVMFPLSFSTLVPVRNGDQLATDEKAMISCTLISLNDAARNCP